MLTVLCHATILTGDAAVEGHALLLKDGKVQDIVREAQIPKDATRLSYPDRILAPGFIDAQVNGGGNRLFNQDPTAETALAIAAAHHRYGTTRLLLTCITDQTTVLPKAIAAMRAARQKDKGILGIHAEGPHLSRGKRGIHKELFIKPMYDTDLGLYQPQDGEVMLVTLAPENVDSGLILGLHHRKVVVSIGHSEATPEQVRDALRHSASGFTHLFNGMTGLSARDPGVAGVALDDTQSWCGLIVDGYHVAPEMVRIAIRAKQRGKIILVSDAMPPAATDSPAPFTLYDKTIRVDDGRCVDEEGRLAGAAITLADAVKNCVKLGIDMQEALRMASTYPAAFLQQKYLGKLLPGFEADIVVMDSELRVEATLLAGQMVQR